MSRATVIINTEAARRTAVKWTQEAQLGTRVEFKASKRTLPQNDRMWAMLTDVAQQQKTYPVKLSTDDWKLIFLDALKREVRMVPNLDGTGFVNLGRSSSDLSKEEMSDLMELIAAWGVQNGIVFHDGLEGMTR